MDENQDPDNFQAEETEVCEEDQVEQLEFLDTEIDWYFIEKWDINSKESKTEQSRRLALEFMRLGDEGRQPYVKKFEERESTGEFQIPYKRFEEVPKDAITGQERLAAFGPGPDVTNGALIRTVFGEEADKAYQEKFADLDIEEDLEDTHRVFVDQHPHLEVGDSWEEALCFLSGLYMHEVWDERYDGIRGWAIIIDQVALSSGKARVVGVDSVGAKRFDRRTCDDRGLDQWIDKLRMFNTSFLDLEQIFSGIDDVAS